MVLPLDIVSEEDLYKQNNQGTVSLDTESSQFNPLPPELAEIRAKKFEFGLGKLLNKNKDIFYSDLVSGKEDLVRDEAASKVSLKKATFQQDLISEAAKKKQGPLTNEEADFIISIANESTKTDPKTVLEVEYANEYMNYLDKVFPEHKTFWEEAKEEFPKEIDIIKKEYNTLIAKREIAETLKDNIRKSAKEQSWGGWTVDLLKTVFPGYTETKLRGLVPGTPMFDSLLGENISNQITNLYKLPVEQFQTQLKSILDSLSKDNPQLAVKFAEEAVKQGTSSRTLDNISTLLDLSILPGVLKLGKKGLSKAFMLKDSADLVKDLAKSTENGVLKEADALKTLGDAEGFAVKKASENINKRILGEDQTAKDMLDDLFTYMRSDLSEIKANPGRLGQDLLIKLESSYKQFEKTFTDAVSNAVKVDRVPVLEATETAVKVLRERVKELYPGLDNVILDLKDIRKNPISNTFSIDLKLGNFDGELFKSYGTAKKTAELMGLKDFKISREGKGRYIKITKPLNENNPVVRDITLFNENAKEPDGWLSAWTRWFINPDDSLSLEQRMARKVATYAPSVLLKVAREEAQYLTQLSKGAIKFDPITGQRLETILFGKKRRWADWNTVVNAGRGLIDPDTGKAGYFFKHPAELEEFYLRHIHRLPDEVEIQAYFSYKRHVEMDRMLRNIHMYRNKHRVGTETHTFTFENEAGEKIEKSFDGVILKELPKTDDTLVVLSRRLGKEHLYNANSMPPKIYKDLKKKVDEGRFKVIEIYEPEATPFKNSGKIGSERVRYVVVENIQTKPISFHQLDRRGGGHWEFDYDFYIKQARVRPEKIGQVFRNWYEGDTTVMPINIRTMGKDIAEKLDKVRLLLRDDLNKEAKEFAKQNLPVEWKELRSWFSPTKVDGVLQPPRLSLEESIRLVPRDKLLIETEAGNELITKYGNSFRDGSRRGSLAKQHQVEFTGERDAFETFTITDNGTRHNPLYKYEPARMINPIASMDRSLSRIINSHFMDDYKILSVENWLRSAGPYLKASENDLRASPFYHFRNPYYRDGLDPSIISSLEGSRKQIDTFMGTKSITDGFLYSTAQKLVDSIYGRFGPKGLVIDPVEVLPRLKHPEQFIRSVTFNAKIGLFAIPQLLVQMQTYGVIYGIAGFEHASSGTLAALLQQYARLNKNPEIINKLDEIASKMSLGGSRWKPGEFKESMEALSRSGFENVMGEYSLLDSAMSPRVHRTAFGNFLDAGQFFFREGERSVRYGAWHTAYREFRNANPVRKLTDKDMREILERADILSVNMSRASSSAIHTGILSIPTQFLTYQLRLAELMFGKRLSAVEKGRLFAWQAGLYGVPTATGVSGFPIGDYIRQSGLEHGYIPGENWVNSALNEGLPSTIIALTTGNWYNIGDRYGSQGFEVIREALRTDEGMYKILFGAAGSVFGNTLANTDGFWYAMTSAFRDDDKVFPIKPEDILDMAKEVSSVSGAWKTLVAIHTGRWLSRKEHWLDTVSPSSAVIMGLTGLQPQGVSDLHLQSITRKNQLSLEKHVTEQFVQEFRRGVKAGQESPENASVYFRRAFALLKIGGINDDKIPAIITRAVKDNESLVDQMDWNFYIKNAPKGMEETLRKAYIEKQKQKGIK